MVLNSSLVVSTSLNVEEFLKVEKKMSFKYECPIVPEMLESSLSATCLSKEANSWPMHKLNTQESTAISIYTHEISKCKEVYFWNSTCFPEKNRPKKSKKW